MKWTGLRIVIRNAFMSDMEYRINYIVLILAGLITVTMEMAIFTHLYRDQTQIGFLPQDYALSFIVVGMLLRYSFTDWSLTQDLISEIKEGSFRRFLLQPIQFSTFFYASMTGKSSLNWLLSLVVVLSLKHWGKLHMLFPLSYFPMAILSLALAIVLAWQAYMLMLTLGFWLHEAGFLMMAFNIGVGLFSGSVLPLDWLPAPLPQVIALTPFPLLGDVPVRTALGLIEVKEWWSQIGLALCWILTLSWAIGFLWKRGARHYEAFGG